ncbi:hypothetical protein [Chryseobacterium sp.]|nr:hypothetical protein [Chryseobacterium sp.]
MKIRKYSSWKDWQATKKKQSYEIFAIHIAVIVGVFVVAAIL